MLLNATGPENQNITLDSLDFLFNSYECKAALTPLNLKFLLEIVDAYLHDVEKPKAHARRKKRREHKPDKKRVIESETESESEYESCDESFENSPTVEKKTINPNTFPSSYSLPKIRFHLQSARLMLLYDDSRDSSCDILSSQFAESVGGLECQIDDLLLDLKSSNNSRSQTLDTRLDVSLGIGKFNMLEFVPNNCSTQMTKRMHLLAFNSEKSDGDTNMPNILVKFTQTLRDEGDQTMQSKKLINKEAELSVELEKVTIELNIQILNRLKKLFSKVLKQPTSKARSEEKQRSEERDSNFELNTTSVMKVTVNRGIDVRMHFFDKNRR